MGKTRTYRAWVFASFYYGVLVVIAAGWFAIVEASENRVWGAVTLIAFGLLGLPFVWAKVAVDDEGITQQILRRRSVRWTEVISWERIAHPDTDGPDTIKIKTRKSSFTLNHNFIYGRRLDDIESELRRRTTKPDDVESWSQAIRPQTSRA
jgi:hypothetical protein